MENHKGLESVKDGIGKVFIVLRYIAVLLAISFFISGIEFLEQYERAVVVRFGELRHEIKEDPGLVFALPFPIDEVIKIPTKRTQILESDTFWHRGVELELDAGVIDGIRDGLIPGRDGYLITADRNILHIHSTLRYRVTEPTQFSFAYSDVKKLLRLCLDNAVVKAVSNITMEQVLRDKNTLSKNITAELSFLINGLKIGINIDPVDLEIAWPRQLSTHINNVVEAKQQSKQSLSTAKLYANSQIDKAESQSSQLISKANTLATRVTSRSNADAATFKKLFPLYQKKPDVIKQTLYHDRMRKIMANVEEIFIIDQSDNREVRINLHRKENQKDNGRN